MPVRLAHWLLAALVLGAFALANLVSDESVAFAWHAIAGLIAVFVIALRLVWGLVGTRYARFGDFSLRPTELARYLRGVFSRDAEGSGAGHNPATSWFAIVIYAGILGLGITGFLTARGNESAEEIHEVLAWSVIGLVVMHVVGVLLHVVRKRENLIASMITGRKIGADLAGIPSARVGTAGLLIGLVVAFGALLLSGFDAGTRRLTLPIVGTTLTIGDTKDKGGIEHQDATGKRRPGGGDDESNDHEDEDRSGPRGLANDGTGGLEMGLHNVEIFVMAVMMAGVVLPAVAADDRPTAGFRAEHAEIKEHLRHLDGMVGALDGAVVEERQRTMTFVVKFLDEHIRSHAAWEEAHLYPVVDERAGRQGQPFTASMRYEHGIIGRAIDGLSTLAAATPPDAKAFARAADRVLGIIGAHFEKEEEVFLPLLDRSMTRAEVEAVLKASSAH
ncbi:MAG: cytochrome b/b6 domain-containing protein [Thermoanaerobaculia bacterium]